MPLQANGFQLVGFCLPFLLFGAFAGVLGSMVMTVMVPLVIGLFLAFGRGVGGNVVWWKNAGRYLVAGAVNGAVMALFLVTMVSCVSGAGRAGFVGR